MQDTPFRLRLFLRYSVGRIVKYNGKIFSLPLYHHRPPKPFQPRLTRAEKIKLDDMFESMRLHRDDHVMPFFVNHREKSSGT
jgi:hypothetical protein